jgi:uncharacterized protein YoxC
MRLLAANASSATERVNTPTLLASIEANIARSEANAALRRGNAGAGPPPPGALPPPPVTSWRSSLKPLFDQAIADFATFRIQMNVDPFKSKLAAISAMEKELDTLEGRVGKLTGEAVQLDNQLKGSGMLGKGTTNFRGKAGPTVYAAKKGNSFEARGNFSIDAFNFRATNDSSFDAVLKKMQTMQTAVSGLITQARAKRNELMTAQSELNTKAKQYVEAIKGLRKAISEEAKKLSQLASAASRTRITAAPSQAQNVLGAYAEQKPGFFSRFFKRSAKGGTRRRAAGKKTRKGRKNSRR